MFNFYLSLICEKYCQIFIIQSDSYSFVNDMIVLCVGLQGWMGEDCFKLCIYGKVDGVFCVCDFCYTGVGCELECFGNGCCVNNICDCFFIVIGINCY